jgi:hypothetical protein
MTGFTAMSPDLKPVTFRLDRYLLEGLDEVKRRDGIAATEQVRRALIAWLEGKGVIAKPERKRVRPRKRP